MTNFESRQPLSGVRVLDFSTLLPGPMAGLILAEAGADVIKIERPGAGEDMRHYEPKWGRDSAYFAMLNRGKRSLALDLKNSESIIYIKKLMTETDVILEQFRPGVMARLGLGYEDLRKIKPGLIYCSITGYGADGPKAQVAGHDLNYIGDTGLLSLGIGPADRPVIPPALIADLAGGTYPAVVNILLALLHRHHTGEGCHLDIAMTDNMFMLAYWAIAEGQLTGEWPESGSALLTGGSPRYRIYPALDGRFVAVAALEQKFWERFCDLVELEEGLRNDSRDKDATIVRVTELISARNGDYWRQLFDGEDCCCSVVQTLQEATQDPHFRQRGLFDHKLGNEQGGVLPATAVPVVPAFRSAPTELQSAPELGSANDDVLGQCSKSG